MIIAIPTSASRPEIAGDSRTATEKLHPRPGKAGDSRTEQGKMQPRPEKD